MNLSDHFTLAEMTRTDIRWLVDENKADAVEYIPNLKRVCDELLEPIRALFHNAPIYVHSGYRCARLNSVIGGSPTSQHMLGQAVDFDVDGHVDEESLLDAVHIIMASHIRFKQLLIENGCLHISLPNENTTEGEVAYWDKGIKVNIRMAV